VAFNDFFFISFPPSRPSQPLMALSQIVATLLWVKCEDETPTPKVGDLESSGTPERLEFNTEAKTPFIGVFLVSLESF